MDAEEYSVCLLYTSDLRRASLVGDRFAELSVIALALLGWAVVAAVVLTVPVSIGAQAVFYIAGFVALSGTAALAFELFFMRSGQAARPRAINLVGSGMRLAFVAEFALWLQSLRMLSFAYAVLIMAGLVLFEYLIRQLAGGRWSQGN